MKHHEKDNNIIENLSFKNVLVRVSIQIKWCFWLVYLTSLASTELYSTAPEKIPGIEEFINFIALIHPIQWTIALPVSATGPAKCQKKMSCI